MIIIPILQRETEARRGCETSRVTLPLGGQPLSHPEPPEL